MSGVLSAPVAALQQDDTQWVMAAKDYASTRHSRLNEINTNNVTRLTLREMNKAQRIMIDGKKLTVTSAPEIRLENTTNGWRVATGKPPGLQKTHALQGPIDDAFLSRFVVVRPTRKPASELIQRWIDFELAHLQARAPAMHPTLARAQFRAVLGKNPEDVFERFEPEAFAAASLGQVHRAITKSGENVVGKIQYPAIRTAVENDFKLFRSATFPGRVSGHFPDSILEEVEAGFLKETDYQQEARNIEFFREQLAPLEKDQLVVEVAEGLLERELEEVSAAREEGGIARVVGHGELGGGQEMRAEPLGQQGRGGNGGIVDVHVLQAQRAGDRVVFDKAGALARTSGDRRLLKEIVALFRADYPASLRQLNRAVAERKAEALRTTAHALKGALGTIVAEPARQASSHSPSVGSRIRCRSQNALASARVRTPRPGRSATRP